MGDDAPPFPDKHTPRALQLIAGRYSQWAQRALSSSAIRRWAFGALPLRRLLIVAGVTSLISEDEISLDVHGLVRIVGLDRTSIGSSWT